MTESRERPADEDPAPLKHSDAERVSGEQAGGDSAPEPPSDEAEQSDES